jgi:hypothetical protein
MYYMSASDVITSDGPINFLKPSHTCSICQYAENSNKKSWSAIMGAAEKLGWFLGLEGC